MTLYDIFENQLNDLIMIQNVTNEKTYQYIRNNHTIYRNNNIDLLLPYDYNKFRKIVNNSILILAYSYFEDFIIELAKACYVCKPELLINDCSPLVLKRMINKIENKLSHNDLRDKIKFYKNKLNVKFEKEDIKKIDEVRLIRNSILHNNGCVNKALSELFPTKYMHKQEILLNFEKLSKFSDFGRRFCKDLYDKVNELYNVKEYINCD